MMLVPIHAIRALLMFVPLMLVMMGFVFVDDNAVIMVTISVILVLRP
jgi:hypothetical protein